METTSTPRVWQSLRAFILSFETPEGNHKPSDVLGADSDTTEGRLYYNQAPDKPVYPYAVARLINRRTSAGGVRVACELELMLFDRPRAKQTALETLADWIEGALVGYRSSASGFLMTSAPDRDTLPVTPTPGDREVVQIRIVSPVIMFPMYLTQHSIPG